MALEFDWSLGVLVNRSVIGSCRLLEFYWSFGWLAHEYCLEYIVGYEVKVLGIYLLFLFIFFNWTQHDFNSI